MIYEFKSRVTGTVVATKDVAERILSVIGKKPAAKGVILPEQMPAAIAALERAIEAERAAPESAGKAAPGKTSPNQHDQDDAQADPITLAQRAFPFLEMLQTASAAGKEITWGV